MWNRSILTRTEVDLSHLKGNMVVLKYIINVYSFDMLPLYLINDIYSFRHTVFRPDVGVIQSRNLRMHHLKWNTDYHI